MLIRCFLITKVIVLIFLLSNFSQMIFCQQISDEKQANTPNKLAEDWIKRQLERGLIADLEKGFVTEKERVISGKFFEQLLSSSVNSLTKYPKGIDLRNAIIIGKVDLSYSSVNEPVILVNCKFNSLVSFNNTTFNRNLFCLNSVFNDAVDFLMLVCNGMAVFRNSIFKNDIMFGYARIAYNLDLSNVLIDSGVTEANFRNMKIGSHLAIKGGRFRKIVNFSNSKVDGDLIADSSSFEKDAKFSGIDVTGNAALSHIIFNGNVNFSRFAVKRNFESADSRFNGNVEFYQMIVGESLVLDGSTFNGRARFTYSKIGIILALNSTIFGGETLIDFVDIGEGQFVNTQFKSKTRFANANFLRLDFVKVGWYMSKQELLMHSIRFEDLAIDTYNPEKTCDTMLNILERSVYSAETYTNFEALYTRQGNVSLANRVFVSRMSRERQENISQSSLSLINLWYWLKNFLSEKFIGYGRHPEYAFLWVMVLLTMGCFIFKKSNMESIVQNSNRNYSASLYSFDLLIPFVSLPSLDNWKPKESKKLICIYYRIHKVAGSLLISIGILTWMKLIE